MARAMSYGAGGYGYYAYGGGYGYTPAYYEPSTGSYLGNSGNPTSYTPSRNYPP